MTSSPPMTAFETRGRRYRLVIGTHLCHANSLTAIVLRLRDLSPHEPANIFTIHLESDFLLDHPASLQRGSSGQGGARDRSSQSGGRWSSLPSPLLRVRTTATTSVTTFVVPTPLSLSLSPLPLPSPPLSVRATLFTHFRDFCNSLTGRIHFICYVLLFHSTNPSIVKLTRSTRLSCSRFDLLTSAQASR